MMKKMVSMAMAAVMAATLMVAAAPAAEVNAEEVKTQDTPVSYENKSTSEIIDADYTVTIPRAITFTAETKKVDANVTLAPTVAGEDLGQLKVKVTVESDGDYNLVNTTNTEDKLTYSLTYATVMSAENTEVAELDKDNADANGSALLTDANAATKSGTYTDTLTYTITKLTNVDGSPATTE